MTKNNVSKIRTDKYNSSLPYVYTKPKRLRPYSHYFSDFREFAVSLFNNTERTQAEIARALDIPEQTMNNWIRKSKTKKRYGSQYSDGFKESALTLVSSTNKPIYKVAKDLGMSESTLYKWVGKYLQSDLPIAKSLVASKPRTDKPTYKETTIIIDKVDERDEIPASKLLELETLLTLMNYKPLKPVSKKSINENNNVTKLERDLLKRLLNLYSADNLHN